MEGYVSLSIILIIILVLGRLAIKRQLHAHRQSELQQSQLNALLDNIPHLAWFKNLDGRYMAINQPYLKLLGAVRSEVIGKTDFDLWPKELALTYQQEDQKVLETGQRTKVVDRKPIQDRELWVETYKSPVFDANGELWGTTGISLDITERQLYEEEIYRMVYFDELTNLPNRRYIKERLDNEMKSVGPSSTSGAVLFIDMDDLKLINDTFGHVYGDDVIRAAGTRILAEAGENAIVARIGGDEFIVLLPAIADRDEVESIADRLVKAINKDYMVNNSLSHMSASVGIALYPLDGNQPEEILKNADAALSVAKARGKNTWRFYDADIFNAAYENMLLKYNLRGANERGELSLYYQPQVTISDRSIIGFEALLRWQSPEHGCVSPSRFIPLAEENDTIHEIGNWVLDKACEFARNLADMGKEHLCVWVNVSPRQLIADDFVSIVSSAIASAQINPGQLGLEITENVLIDSLNDCIHKLLLLKDLGVNLSLDDFGTGYSSLTYLRRLPVKTLKIDKSFIDDIAFDDDQVSFVHLIIEMAHTLGLIVVAEGVESEPQIERLMRCRCDYIQGYVFSCPVPEQDAIKLLICNKT